MGIRRLSKQPSSAISSDGLKTQNSQKQHSVFICKFTLLTQFVTYISLCVVSDLCTVTSVLFIILLDTVDFSGMKPGVKRTLSQS